MRTDFRKMLVLARLRPCLAFKFKVNADDFYFVYYVILKLEAALFFCGGGKAKGTIELVEEEEEGWRVMEGGTEWSEKW